MQQLECSHGPCNCTVPGEVGGEAYCSEDCRDAEVATIETDMCACGHPPCDED
jgi:hypothetical protein